MTNIRLMASRQEALPVIEAALGMSLARDGEHLVTYTAFLLRRLVGMLGPCRRRDVISRTKLALTDHADIDVDVMIKGALEDLIVGGDVLELPVLIGEQREDSCLRLLGAPPSFVVCGQRVRIVGIAPDDARFLPEELHRNIQSRGGDRFIEAEDTAELIQLLTGLGLRRIDLARWLGKERDVPAEAFVKNVTERMTRLGRVSNLADASWLWPSDERHRSYRSRWRPEPVLVGPAIVRAPQRYGNPRWYLAETRNDELRLLDLPFEGEVSMRGCDFAWTIQLALDHIQGFPSRYNVQVQDARWTRIRVEFPLPLGIRRRLLHLGGHRSGEEQGFYFYIPTADLESAEAILSGAWMVPGDNGKSS